MARGGPLRRGIGASVTFVLRVLPLIGLLLVAVAPLAPVFDRGLPVAVICAVLLGVAGAELATWRLPAWLSLVAGAAVGAVYVGAMTSSRTIAGAVPTPGSVADAAYGATAGWRDLLTVGLPTTPAGTALAAPVALAFVAAWLTVELAERRRTAALAVCPAIAVIVVCGAVAASRGAPGVATAAAFTGLVLVHLAVRAGTPGATAGAAPTAARWLAFALPLVAVLTAAGVAASSLLPLTAGGRFDLRDVIEQPVRPREEVSPLSRIGGQLDQRDGPPLFDVTVDGAGGAAPVPFLPVAYLDTYDGALWTTSAAYSRPGRDLPPPPAGVAPTGVATTDVAVRVRLREYESSFLPFLPGATTVEPGPLGYDEQSRSLVVDGPATGGFTYAFTAAVPDAGQVQSRTERADAASGELADHHRPAPALPPRLAALAEEIRTHTSTTYTRLDLLDKAVSEGDLRTNRRTASGHSLGRLERFLGAGDDPAARHFGTSEQAAAAFAVIARTLGIPTRIAVGYDVPAGPAGQPVEVPADAIRARPEVLLADVGWVPFDVGPTQQADIPERQNQGAPDPARPGSDTIVPPPVVAPDLPGPVPLGGDVAEPAGSRWPWLLLLLLLVAVVLLALPGLLKQLRRQRRHTGPPAAQVLGAAAEMRDRFVERRYPTGAALTLANLAQLGEEGPLPEGAVAACRRLRPLVDLALFSRRGPELPDVAGAWQCLAAFEHELRAAEPVRRRIRYQLDPRPLLGRHRAGAAPARPTPAPGLTAGSYA